MVGFVPKDAILSLRIPTELHDCLKACASDKSMTVSFLVLKMIDEGLLKYQK